MFLLPSVMVLVSAQAATPVQERADRFLDVVNASFKALTYVASKAQWAAATDVTPGPRRGLRDGEPGHGGLHGESGPHHRGEGPAGAQGRAEAHHRPPARARAPERGRRADDEPEARGRPDRRRDAAGLHAQQLRVQARREADHGQRDRRHPLEQQGPEGAPGGVGGLEAVGPRAEARPREASGAAQRRREGAGASRTTSPSRSRATA